MAVELLSPKVVSFEETPKVRTLQPVPTAVTAMPLVTEKGPVLTPTLTTTFDEWVRVFGRAISASKSFAHVEQFYNNGGRNLYTSRVVHYTDVSNPATKTSVQASVTLQDITPVNVLQVKGKYDGAYANALSVVIAAATNGLATHFNLSVVEAGVTLEVFPNLINDPTASNDAATVINSVNGGSNFISATNIATARPVNGSFTPVGGNNGLTGLADTDYIGSQAGGTGFFGFDGINDIRIILAPDRTTAPVQTALFDYADVTRNRSMFSIPTIPLGLTDTTAITFVKTTAALKGRGEVGATYWPNAKITNPNKTAYGNTDTVDLEITPLIAGLYTKVDGSRVGGVYVEPAGEENGILRGIVGLESTLTQQERKRDLLYPERINPVWKPNGLPFIVDGNRNLKADGNWPTVAQRRGVIFIQQSIQDGLTVYKHRHNDDELREEVAATIRSFLLIQFRADAFRGDTPDQSYFVDVSEDINPPSEVNLGILNVRIGLATQRPVDFIVLRFSQDLRDLEAELAAA